MRLSLVLAVLISVKAFSQSKSFVPDSFKVPDSLVGAYFKLKPLSTKYGEMDYKAVTGSLDHLRGIFGPNSDWPNPKMSLQESLESIEADHSLFKKRMGFSYSVLNSTESEVIGCVYIFPTQRDYDAEVVMWVSKEYFDKGFDTLLFLTVDNWLLKSWPFKRIAYPGRKIKWHDQ